MYILARILDYSSLRACRYLHGKCNQEGAGQQTHGSRRADAVKPSTVFIDPNPKP